MEKDCNSLPLPVEDDSPGDASLNATMPDGNSDQSENTAVPSGGDSRENRLAVLSKEINDLHDGCENSYPEMGEKLLQAKDIHKGHGTWTKWLMENFTFSVRHAQRLIRVAEMYRDTTLVSDINLTPSKAYILTRIDRKELDSFCHNLFCVDNETGVKKPLKNMTKREIDKVVKDHLSRKIEEKSMDNIKVLDNANGTVDSYFKALEKALTETITSIKISNEGPRHLWIEKLEELYQSKMGELTIDVE